MDINAFNALKTYNSAQKTLSAGKPDNAGLPQEKAEFKPAAMAKDLVGAVAQSESAAAAFMTGNADPHSVVEAMASAELAVETAVTLRNRVVEAYQELLRMPI